MLLIKRPFFCAMETMVTVIRCCCRYFRAGSPVGRGRASGRAVRASRMAILSVGFTLTCASWGLEPVFGPKG